MSLDPALARFLRDELGHGAPAADAQWQISSPVWIWRGNGNGPPPKAAWYFITIAGEAAKAIQAASGAAQAAWGSVKVEALIGETRWQTSLFPSKEAGGWLLPLKAAVRRAESLDDGHMVEVTLRLAPPPVQPG